MRPVCPTCGKAEDIGEMAEWPYFPFCSRKCKLIDLGRWFDEDYSVPAEEPDDPEGES
jgi:uncharacterized protein